MNFLQAVILGLVQGATEFVPISSSAHLVLVPWALGWPSPDLAYDTMVHWGTLVAVLAYFWKDLWQLLSAWAISLPALLRARALPQAPEACLAWWIILGTLPAAILGALFEDFFASLFASPQAVGAFLLVTAVLLASSERLGPRVRALEQMTISDALLIGLAQAAAIAPGISRSGATISMGLARGLQREAAARFSFLLSTPIILGAGLLQLKALAETSGALSRAPLLSAGFLAAAISGYLCIRFLLSYLRRGRLYIFAIYCALLGFAVLLATALY
jgi:undecaprenyl-diphosphatase